MAKNNNLTDFLTDLATGIRNTEASVTGTASTAKINPQNFRSRVEKIYTDNTVARANTTISVTADDTNDKLTITAGNNQLTGYVAGANKTTTTTVTLTASGANVTATVGDKSVTKSVGTVTHSAPTATLDTTTGKVTTKHTTSAGYVSAGTTTATLELSTVTATTVTPGTQDKPAVAQGKYTLGTVTVKGDADLVAGNIKSGVEIFGVTGTFTNDADAASANILSGKTAYVGGAKVMGTMTNNGAATATLTTLSTSYTIPAGYHNGSGKVSITVQSKNVTPTTYAQTIFADSNKVLQYVKVASIPNQRLHDEVTANGPTVTVPLGYYGAAVTKTVATVDRAATTMVVTTDTTNKKLTYTASNNQATGYVAGANKATSATVTLSTSGETVTMSDGTNSVSLDYPTLSCQTVTPSVTSQTVSVSGKYMTGNVVVGAIPNQRNENAITTIGPTVIIPYGYYFPTNRSYYTKTVTTASHTSPTITIATATGIITASHTQITGYVEGHTTTATYQLPAQAARTVTPTTQVQTAVSGGIFTTGPITVKGDPNLIASNIKSGVSIFGVNGSYYSLPEQLVFGTYIMKGEQVSGLDTIKWREVSGLYTYFYMNYQWVLQEISSITSYDDGSIQIDSKNGPTNYYIGGGWEDEEGLFPGDPHLQVLYCPEPIQIPYYAWFSQLVMDYNQDEDAFNKGVEYGSTSLEALGVLCSWDVMTDESSYPVITIYNRHPTHYLKCTIYNGDNLVANFDDGSGIVTVDGVVTVWPDDCATFIIEDIFSGGPVFVDDVRWTKDE